RALPWAIERRAALVATAAGDELNCEPDPSSFWQCAAMDYLRDRWGEGCAESTRGVCRSVPSVQKGIAGDAQIDGEGSGWRVVKVDRGAIGRSEAHSGI